jgi:hypothetical protein
MMTPATTIAMSKNTPEHLVLWKQKLTKGEENDPILNPRFNGRYQS